MPRGRGGRRKKARTHTEGEAAGAGAAAAPRSLVFRSGRPSQAVKALTGELRDVLGPYTARRLRDRRGASLKDFASVSGALGVTHLVNVSQPDEKVNLKVGRTPQGPTVTFQVASFSLCRHVRALQRRPADASSALQTAPLVVLNNFGGDERPHVRLAAVTLQNMFPAIDVGGVELRKCQRVVLFHLDGESDCVEMRHYSIRAVPTGVHRGLRRVVQAKVPDLRRLEDVADLLLGDGGAESEAEDEEASVVLPQRYGGRGNAKAQKTSVRLAELGPRLRLRLLKVERGLAAGDVLFHAHFSKTPEEAAALRAAALRRQEERQRRREEQEANVDRKRKARADKKAAREERKRRRTEARAEEGEGEGEGSADGSGREDDLEDDLEAEIESDLEPSSDDGDDDDDEDES